MQSHTPPPASIANQAVRLITCCIACIFGPSGLMSYVPFYSCLSKVAYAIMLIAWDNLSAAQWVRLACMCLVVIQQDTNSLLINYLSTFCVLSMHGESGNIHTGMLCLCCMTYAIPIKDSQSIELISFTLTALGLTGQSSMLLYRLVCSRYHIRHSLVNSPITFFASEVLFKRSMLMSLEGICLVKAFISLFPWMDSAIRSPKNSYIKHILLGLSLIVMSHPSCKINHLAVIFVTVAMAIRDIPTTHESSEEKNKDGRCDSPRTKKDDNNH